jgi:DNA adenine methylase
MTTKPVLKWVGGKTQILDSVLELFPRAMKDYYEPFVGGGSVLLGLLGLVRTGVIRLTGKIYASDINPHLISLYTCIQREPDALIAAVKALTDNFARCPVSGGAVNRKASTHEEALTSRESYYYWIRARFNAGSGVSPVERAAMLLFLNKTCFRGVYREGPRGFNVPYGNYKNPTVLDEAHIRAVSDLFRCVEFRACAFPDALAGVTAGDFVYLDPPYAPESSTSFVSYTADGFGEANHRLLFRMCHETHAKGVKLLMSNADVPFVKEAFTEPAFHTKIISCRRAIHSKRPDAVTNEVLITN